MSRRRGAVTVGALLLACAVAATVVVAWPDDHAASGRPRVVIFGDSLAYQAEPYFDRLVEAGGRATVSNFAFGGTAVCDWLPEIRSVASSEHPQAAVIEFAGNTFTSCMDGCVAGSEVAISRYCSDLSVAIHDFTAVGTHVFLEGTPIDHQQWATHDPQWNALNDAVAGLAKEYPGQVTYVDAGQAVEGPGHSFVWNLPCLSSEPCTGPTVGGVRTNMVRSPDGIHFCVGQSGNAVGQVDPCRGYSSGAFRFAAAMAGPVLGWLHL